MSRRTTRKGCWQIGLLALVTLWCLTTTAAAERRIDAHAARTLSADVTAHLHLVRSSGAEITEQGTVSGSLSGTVKGSFNVGATVTGSVTLYVHGAGSINGHGSGSLHNGHGGYESFGGSLTITGGSGRYRHAGGKVGFYGSINRRTDAMVVQTRGAIHY